MLEIPWASPTEIGKLTIPLLLCLLSADPPDERRAKTFEDYLELSGAEAEIED